MTQPQSPSVPATIVAAIIALILAALFSAFSLTKLDTDSAGYDISLIAGGVFVAALAFAAFGTWRDWLPAQAVAVVCGGVMILGGFAFMSEANVLARLAGVQDYGVALLIVGLACVGLVIVPRSSRNWVDYKH